MQGRQVTQKALSDQFGLHCSIPWCKMCSALMDSCSILELWSTNFVAKEDFTFWSISRKYNYTEAQLKLVWMRPLRKYISQCICQVLPSHPPQIATISTSSSKPGFTSVYTARQLPSKAAVWPWQTKWAIKQLHDCAIVNVSPGNNFNAPNNLHLRFTCNIWAGNSKAKSEYYMCNDGIASERQH